MNQKELYLRKLIKEEIRHMLKGEITIEYLYNQIETIATNIGNRTPSDDIRLIKTILTGICNKIEDLEDNIPYKLSGETGPGE